MAYRMACETDIFAAVGVDSTTMLARCGQVQPTSVLHIHGTADPIIPYPGGTGEPYSLTGSTITAPPLPTVVTTSIASCPTTRPWN